MKQVFAIFCAVILMPGLNAHAWVGGPWSNNNSQPSGDDGIYEAVATMSNGTGFYRWAVRNNSTGATATASDVNVTTAQSGNVLFGGGTLGTVSVNVWYYQGITYYGRTFGMVNSAMGIVTAISNATTITNNSGDPTINNVPVSRSQSNNNGIEVENFANGQENILVTVSPQPFPASVNTSFTAKMKNNGVKRFSGSGEASFLRSPNSIRLISFFILNQTDITVDGTSTTGEDPDSFEQQGHNRKFKVMGTQVSTQVFP